MTGLEFKAARLLLGYKTQAEIAKQLGVNPGTIYRLERKQGNIPVLYENSIKLFQIELNLKKHNQE